MVRSSTNVPLVITGVHAILYAPDADATRQFIKDELGYDFADAGHGWLIFALPPAEVAAHPTDGPPSQELYFMCDDVEATMRDLRDKGVEFTHDITEERWGRVTRFRLPGGGEVGMYEPRHPRAIDL